jgi:hypothetical protein
MDCFKCNVLISFSYAMFLFYFHMQCFIKSVGRVMKPMRHPFWTDMSHMCHASEM